MGVCQLVMSPSATPCHPLLGFINEYVEKAGLGTPFSQIFKGFPDMSPKIRSAYISGSISTSLGNFVLGLGLVFIKKLDGVGPVDNRPSTDNLHHFVWKKKKMWHVTCDTWHVTSDTWHVTCDTWHVTRNVTRDTWHVTCLGGEHSLKISAP